MIKSIAAGMFLLLAGTANATEYLYSRMSTNAVLVLTSDKNDCIFGKSGFLMSQTGKLILTHCWENTETDSVRVTYSDGDTRYYAKKDFVYFENKEKPNY